MEAQRMRDEMRIARQIQQKLFPVAPLPLSLPLPFADAVTAAAVTPDVAAAPALAAVAVFPPLELSWPDPLAPLTLALASPHTVSFVREFLPEELVAPDVTGPWARP